MKRECSSCRFWGWPDEAEWYGTKTCALFSDWPRFTGAPEPLPEGVQPLARVAPFAGADGGGLTTESTFGCIQWMRR